MATIINSTQASPFAYPSNSYMERSPYTGKLWTMVRNSAGALVLYYSTNNGASWNADISFTRSNLQEWSDIFIDKEGYLHVAYRVYESGRDKICYRRSDGYGWSDEVVVTSATAAGSGAAYQGMSLVAMVFGRHIDVHIAVGTTSGGNIGVSMFGVTQHWHNDWWYGGYWDYDVVTLLQGTTKWFIPGTGRISPALDFRHNGDAHSSSVPDLWLAFGRTQVNVVKIPYSSGRWTGPINSTVLATNTTAADYTPGRFDGSRFLVPILAGSNVNVMERDLSNTVTNLRSSPAHPTGVVRHVAINYVPSTGDFRLYAVGTSTAVLYYVDYVRASASWGTWTTTGQTLATVSNFGTRRGSYGNSRFDYYTQTGTTPFTLASHSQALVFAPNTPVPILPMNGAAYDVANTLPFSWEFVDVDTSDQQGGYALSRQIGAGALSYWRASDSTWQASEVQNATSTEGVELPTGWGADSDANHTYKVKTWDSTGLPSSYTSGIVVIPSARIEPIITYPDTVETANVEDTFTRVSADLNGDTPDVGSGVWLGGAGKWSVDGTQAVWASGAVDMQYLSQGTAGDVAVRAEGLILNTLAGGSTKTFYLSAKGDSGFVNMLTIVIEVATNGTNTISLYKKIGGISTLLAQAINQLPASSAYTLDATLTVEHAVVTATVGPVTLQGIITQAEVTGLAGNLFNGFGANSATSIARFYVNKVVPQTVTSSDITVEWTVTSQKSFRVVLYEADSSILVKDSGVVTSVATSYRIPYALENNTRYRIDLITTNTEGLSSNVQTITFAVDFVEPAEPEVVITELPADGLIRISMTNPDPAGLEPTPRTNTVYRRRVSDTSTGDPLATTDASDSTNMAAYRNYSFEEALGTTWQSDNISKSTVARVTTQAQLGAASLEQTAVSGTGFGGAYLSPTTSLPAVAGTSYTLRVYIKATVGRTINARLSWRQANESDNGNSNVGSVVADGTWQEITADGVAPANTGYMVPIIGWSDSANVAGEKCWLDNVRVEVTGDMADPVVHDDITAASGIEYEYRVLTTADNGTSTYTDWQA